MAEIKKMIKKSKPGKTNMPDTGKNMLKTDFNHHKMHALIVANGAIENPSLILEILLENYHFNNKYLIISADGAVKNCLKLELVPDVIVGDMDSIEENDKKIIESQNIKTTYVKSPAEKNESDTQLAIEYAIKNKIKNIILIGALGKRMDHSLANLFNIASERFKNINIRILDDNYEISVLRNSGLVKGITGNILSIFSLTPSTYFINTDGLKYKLQNEHLMFSPIRGISNIFEKESAYIDFKDGTLLLIKEIRHL
ncbi:thiamine diphosphokinase [bacterium]|nr:thiamine diphosphokinase [bacterium]